MSARRRPPWAAVTVAAAAVALVALPLVALARQVSWSRVFEHLTTPAARSALWLSLVCSLSAAALSVVLGTPLAWVLARFPFPGRNVVRGLVLLPLVLPPVVGGVALLAAFGRQGLLGGPLHDGLGVQLTFTPAGVVLAQTFVALPFYVITVEAALRTHPTTAEDAATTLGSGPWSTFRRVTLPSVRPAVAAGAVLAWARALGEFGATITFAGNVAGRTQTLPLAVYLQLGVAPDAARSLSIVLVAAGLAVIVGLRSHWLPRR